MSFRQQPQDPGVVIRQHFDEIIGA